MADDDNKKPTAKLVSVAFREGVTLSNVSTVKFIHLQEKQFERWEVAVVGASVFVRAPGQRMVEIPRQMTVLSYEAEGVPFDEAVKQVSGGKR